MGLSASLGQGYSSGGSYGYNNGGSVNSGQSMSNAWSESGTDAMTARQWSMLMSDIAWERDLAAMQMQMNYNSQEAKNQRDWQERMANTIYTRSVKNMREAGINPILAYNMGLSGAGVGSGATASLGGVPSAPLAQNFMDSWSSSRSNSMGFSNGSSWNSGESWSWNNSENGLVTALSALGDIVSGVLSNVVSSENINIALDGLEYITNPQKREEQRQKTNEAVKNNDRNSKDYPHEPGKYVGTNILDFAKELTGKILGNGSNTTQSHPSGKNGSNGGTTHHLGKFTR